MTTLQTIKIKDHLPWIVFLRNNLSLAIAYVRYFTLILFYHVRHPLTSVFYVIHRKHVWGSDSSSGGGSDITQTQTIRKTLPALISQLKIKSIVDAPCGDFHWMSKVSLNIESYLGIDIVPDLVNNNQRKHSNETVRFQSKDITKDELPKVDLIICRDCLVHLSNNHIKKALRTFKCSGSKYLLTTTYPGAVKKNWNIVNGMWRPIDLQKPPFNLPRPVKLINEQCTEGTDYREKSLALWRIEDISTQI